MGYSTALDSYNLGDTVRLLFYVRTSTGGLVNSTVRLLLAEPGSTVATVYSSTQVTNTATGTYRKDVRVATAGRWAWRWESTGAIVQVDEGAFAVAPAKASTS